MKEVRKIKISCKPKGYSWFKRGYLFRWSIT